MGNKNSQHSAEGIEQGTERYNQYVYGKPGCGMSFYTASISKIDAKEAPENKLEEKNVKDRKVNTVQEVNKVNGVTQTVKIDTSDIKNLSNEDVSAIAHNVSHKIKLKERN